MPKKFQSRDRNYVEGSFKTTSRPKTPSPKKSNYQDVAVTKDDGKSRCTYVHPSTGKRCLNKLGLYPQFCKLHTMMVHNVYIAPSHIEHGGNGLYAGPYGFKKGDIIGRYSYPWNEVSMGTLEKRCKDDNCWSYVFCDDERADGMSKCWDGLDIRSTLMRNINDAHNSQYRNNSYFDVIKGEVHVIASRKIKPMTEILVSYGKSYWTNKA